VEVWHRLLAQGDSYGVDASVPLVFVHLLREPFLGNFPIPTFCSNHGQTPSSRLCSCVSQPRCLVDNQTLSRRQGCGNCQERSSYLQLSLRIP